MVSIGVFIWIAFCSLFAGYFAGRIDERGYWFRPKPKALLRRLEIPADKVLEIKRLADQCLNRKGRGLEARHVLWSAVAEIFPEVRQGGWNLAQPTALRVEIVECLPEGSD